MTRTADDLERAEAHPHSQVPFRIGVALMQGLIFWLVAIPAIAVVRFAWDVAGILAALVFDFTVLPLMQALGLFGG